MDELNVGWGKKQHLVDQNQFVSEVKRKLDNPKQNAVSFRLNQT